MSDVDHLQTATPKRRWLRILVALFGLLIFVAVGLSVWIPTTANFQVDGTITLSGPRETITIVRDEKGMPYVHAASLRDAMFGQGFATAQDRLFQIQLMRMQAEGRLTELAGDVAKEMDIKHRTIGIASIAEQHAAILDDPSRDVLQAYVDGINAFLDHCQSDVPIEFSLAGITPDRWSIKDSLSILYLMSWDTSANLNHELVGQMLIDQLGVERATELMPVNVNPDWPAEKRKSLAVGQQTRLVADLLNDHGLRELTAVGPLRLGSNNWATGPVLSAGDQAMVTGDPHLDPRMLPGIMYAIGFVLPEIRAIGAGAPGIPGFIIGRNEDVAIAVTNNYGDVQDLYIETIDPNQPDHYRQGGESIPFDTKTETLKIRDASAADGFRVETFEIRATERGPVVSEILPGLESDKVISLRWAALESMQPKFNLTEFLTAQSVDDVEAAIESVTPIVLNFVFADSAGNIGWHASGRLPIRKVGGPLPFAVGGEAEWEDNWQDWIPFDQMPQQRNPERGWLGTANHYTVPPDYPYYYTNYASPSYRYRRLKQRIAGDVDGLSVEDHWSIQRDTKNLMAESVTPILIAALATDEMTAGLANVLRDWNFRDDIDQAGPTIFQTVYTELAKATFEDELGTPLAERMLGNWYFWQERFERIVLAGDAQWFDDTTTVETTENRNDMIVRAGKATLSRLAPELGDDPTKWHWGRVHHIQWINPLRREGLGMESLGTIPYPAPGSGETLYRGWYDFDDPYDVTHTAAVRMVVDFADAEKVRAVMAGGTTARTFHPHQKDQIDAYLSGQPLHWWLSDQAISDHTQHTLSLVPK